MTLTLTLIGPQGVRVDMHRILHVGGIHPEVFVREGNPFGVLLPEGAECSRQVEGHRAEVVLELVYQIIRPLGWGLRV